MNSNNGYDALRKSDLDLRNEHHRLIQIEDRVAYLLKLKQELTSGNNEMRNRINSLRFQEQAFYARREACQARLDTIYKEVHVELQPNCKKLKESIKDREKKRDYILQFQEEMLRHIDQVLASNLAQYQQMPIFADLEKQKELQQSITEKVSIVGQLREKLCERKSLEEEKWSKFKEICVKAAKNWKDRMAREKLASLVAKFGLPMPMDTPKLSDTPSTPNITIGSQVVRASNNRLLPDPWSLTIPSRRSYPSYPGENGAGIEKIQGFGEAWKNLKETQQQQIGVKSQGTRRTNQGNRESLDVPRKIARFDPQHSNNRPNEHTTPQPSPMPEKSSPTKVTTKGRDPERSSSTPDPLTPTSGPFLETTSNATLTVSAQDTTSLNDPQLDEGVFRRPMDPPRKDMPFCFPSSGNDSESQAGTEPFAYFSDREDDGLEPQQEDSRLLSFTFGRSMSPASSSSDEGRDEDGPFEFNFNYSKEGEEQESFDFENNILFQDD